MNFPLAPFISLRIELECLSAANPGLFPEYQLASALLGAQAAHKAQFDSITIELARAARFRWQMGDLLCFHLFALPIDADKVAALLAYLSSWPEGAKAERGAFCKNWRMVHATDLASPWQFGSASPLPVGFPAAALDDEAANWQGVQQFTLRWTSPVRIGWPKGFESAKTRFLTAEAELTSTILQAALESRLFDLKRHMNLRDWRYPILPLEIVRKELFFIQPTRPADANSPKPADAGLLGELTLRWRSPPNAQQWCALLALQYLGVGQGTRFGLGRMQLEQAHKVSKLIIDVPFTAAAQAAMDTNVRLAHEHVCKGVDLAPWTDQSPDAPDELPVGLESLAKHLKAASYQPAVLYPVDIPKPDGSVRRLLIPGQRDRIAQRALLQIIEPALDALFCDASFGFRRGRGREQARDRLLLLRGQGYEVVAETDIAQFFDEVDWWRIETRLRCLFGFDPIVAQLMRFIEAPSTEQARMRGLPQGSSLSPILSNLMLDHLDKLLDKSGAKHVRFADDLVILTKTESQAEAALSTAAQILADMGLRLKLSKTGITSFMRGFQFLGYQFVGGMALASKGGVPATLLNEKLKEALAATPEPSQVQSSAAGDMDHPGTLLLINEYGAKLRLKRGRLLLRAADASETEHSFATLGAVLLANRCRLSSEVIKAAMRASVPIYFADPSLKLHGSTAGLPDARQLANWQQQHLFSNDKTACLQVARVLVRAKVVNQLKVLRQRQLDRTAQTQLEQLLPSIDACLNMASLLGLEGDAAKRYFRAMAHDLPLAFPFQERQRPAQDPINALLNFGYSFLHRAADAICTAYGLNPKLGTLHRPRGEHAALASDLMEPLRFIVDSQIWTMLNRGELRAGEFDARGDGSCWINTSARQRFSLGLANRFNSPLRAVAADQARSVYGHLADMAASYKIAVLTGAVFYAPEFK